MVVEIPLWRRREIVAHALVDDEDARRLEQHRWHLVESWGGKYRYALRNEGGANVLMHREIMGLPRLRGLGYGAASSRQMCDHINHDGLDNRRENLRVGTNAQNGQNLVVSSRNGASKYRGVSWDGKKERWRAQVWLNGKNHRLGRFKSEEEAARVASDFRRQHMQFAIEPGFAEIERFASSVGTDNSPLTMKMVPSDIRWLF